MTLELKEMLREEVVSQSTHRIEQRDVAVELKQERLSVLEYIKTQDAEATDPKTGSQVN